MKNYRIFLALILLALIVSTNQLKAQDKNLKSSFSIEIDPTTFFFNGYGIHLRLKPKNMDKFLIGVGAYSMDLPDPIINLNKSNRGKDWYLRIKSGLDLFAEHHFRKVNRGWFIGGQGSYQTFILEANRNDEKSQFSNLLFMANGGYTFQPFKVNLFIKPWAGIGYTKRINSVNKIEDAEYLISPVTMFVTFHIGYTF